MKIGVLLAGSGVHDGSEIHEATFVLLALDQRGVEVVCIAPDVPQHHVINHITGEEMNEQRNVLVEAARIARGNIKAISEVDVASLDALVIPGGSGAAKNLSKWAFSGPDGHILTEVANLIQTVAKQGKPLAGLCIGPTIIAKALSETDIKPRLTVGSTEEKSPYDIAAVSSGMESLGAEVTMRTLEEIEIDKKHQIVTAPCYMMEGSISDIHDNIQQAIDALVLLVKNNK